MALWGGHLRITPRHPAPLLAIDSQLLLSSQGARFTVLNLWSGAKVMESVESREEKRETNCFTDDSQHQILEVSIARQLVPYFFRQIRYFFGKLFSTVINPAIVLHA